MKKYSGLILGIFIAIGLIGTAQAQVTSQRKQQDQLVYLAMSWDTWPMCWVKRKSPISK